jgi:predicted small lipoprotein YifL
MKRTFRWLFALMVMALMLVTLTACQDRGPTALNINDLRSDPGAFTGTLTVTGILGAFSQHDPQIFGVMDKSELQCTSPNCNKFYLPVRFAGPIPAYGDEVVVTGSFMPGTTLFAATELKVIRNHSL